MQLSYSHSPGQQLAVPLFASALAPSADIASGARILFVEHHDAASIAIHAELQSAGHEICTIELESEEHAGAAFRPDLVVLDPALGARDGFSILHRLVENGIRCPVLLIDASPIERHSAQKLIDKLGFEWSRSIDRPYGLDAILEYAAQIDPAPVNSQECDRVLLGWLIEKTRLLPNLTQEFLPKMDLKANRHCGFETLTRLRNRRSLSPELIFAPSTLLPLETKASIMALQAAARLCATLRGKGRQISVSANCSSSVIQTSEYVASAMALMREWNLPAGSLTIEVTEDPRPVDTGKLTGAMEMLRGSGIGFALDDFGKHSANLDRIEMLPVNEVKVDKNLFSACFDQRVPPSLLKELIAFCRDRHLFTVIEGIETTEQLDFAQQLGADFGQGFYWGRPMSGGALGI